MEFTEKVWNDYKYSVYKMAWKYVKSHIPFDDLVQEGCKGLSKACESYDGSSSFSTWSHYHIKAKIIKYAKYNSKVIRIPRSANDFFEDVEYQEIYEYDNNENVVEYNYTNKIDVKDALELLTEEERIVIEYFFFKGCSKKETSEATNLSYDVVRNRYRSAMTKLKEYLK